MTTAILLILGVVLALGALAIWDDHLDQRAIRRRHAANPRDERWLCAEIDCTRHLRHRGACNQEGRR